MVAVWPLTHAPAAVSPGVYVALGASDTVGIGARDPAREGWVPLVHAALPAGTQLINLGISGATLADVLAQQAPVAIDARPELVTIWPGVNDLRAGVGLDTFAGRLDTLLSQLSQGIAPGDAAGAQGKRRLDVVVLNIPDLRHVPVFGHTDHAALDATVRAWNTAIAEVAGRHGATLVDLYARWPELAGHPEYISGDGFHPSNAGYRRIADLVLEAMRPAMAARSGATAERGAPREAASNRRPTPEQHVSSIVR